MDWKEALATVPREPFVPRIVWVGNPSGEGFVSLDREAEPDQWSALVAGNELIVTQVDDGRTRPAGIGLVPTSSSSKPSLVAAMLDALDLRPGHRALEVGTGTGWNAALISTRVGPTGHVVSIEVDPALADEARRVLHRSGYAVKVVTGDGADGYPSDAPYDRLLATASVRRMPAAWLEQTRPGAVLVAPWGTDYCNGALLTLVRDEDGVASGRFSRNLAFMRLRDQRREFLDPSDNEIDTADKTVTTLQPPRLFDMISFDQAAFTIGLRVPRCYLTVEDGEDDPTEHTIELHDVASGSWARVDVVPPGPEFIVRQLGSRRLWNEAESAYRWWLDHGKPEPKRYGLSVAPDGTQTVWLDEPDGLHHWAV
ncbi:methyltransferase domain-containing protein [Amycolatopsis anabasis]|uniref:methyltransferase domain-containing protein n=1 Tax=Amycolatopsis anabasis TaxID=1840409 RepID=UPI00131B2775|nr:methyltransferase domain-containing protein [Amycolatopsis anabasis]